MYLIEIQTYFPLLLFAGVLSKGHVRCPWHGACFNVATGDIEDFPGLDSLPTFQVTPNSSPLGPNRAVSRHIPLHYCFSECTRLMSVCSRSELRRTE